MNIHISGENRLAPNYELTNNKPKMIQNSPSPNADECPVKVTISEEGKNACKNSVVDTEKTNYDTMLENRANLMEQKPEIHYVFLLGNKLAEITEHDEGYHSIEEKGSALLEAYASAYDEIVQGYADGTRNVYVEDETAESGYRKMTMEEEISGLDAAYQKYVSGFETRIHQAVDASKAFDKYMEKLSKIDIHRAKMSTKAKKFFDKMNEEDIPVNISDSMLGAKQKFIEMYSQYDTKSLSLKSMLENIKIFSK